MKYNYLIVKFLIKLCRTTRFPTRMGGKSTIQIVFFRDKVSESSYAVLQKSVTDNL